MQTRMSEVLFFSFGLVLFSASLLHCQAISRGAVGAQAPEPTLPWLDPLPKVISYLFSSFGFVVISSLYCQGATIDALPECVMDELLAYLGPDYSHLRRSSVLARGMTDGVNLQLEILKWHCLHKGLLGRDRAGICMQCNTSSSRRVYCVRRFGCLPTHLCWECGFAKSAIRNASDLVWLRRYLRGLKEFKDDFKIGWLKSPHPSSRVHHPEDGPGMQARYLTWYRKACMELFNLGRIYGLGLKAVMILARNEALNKRAGKRKAASLSPSS